MATFSQYGVGGFSGGTIAADESYIGALGAFQMMEESAQNERAVFEFVLGCDFAEAATNNGVMTESEFEAINEASDSGIFGKVVAFFRKMVEKIKGILKNVVDKVRAMCTKDGKELVRKFKDQVNKKVTNGDLRDGHFSYKYCPYKSNLQSPDDIAQYYTDALNDMLEVKIKSDNKDFDNKSIQEILDRANSQEKAHDRDKSFNKGTNQSKLNDYYDGKEIKSNSGKSVTYEKDASKALTSSEISDYKDEVLSTLISNTTVSDFAKDFDEYIFDDEETFTDGLNNRHLDNAIDMLQNYEKITQKIEKAQSTSEKKIKNEFIKPAEKIDKEMNRAGKDRTKFYTSSAHARTCAQAVISMGNAVISCIGTVTAGYLAAYKKDYKQSRALYIKVATYNKKAAKNEAALLEAYVDVSNSEVDAMMPEC